MDLKDLEEISNDDNYKKSRIVAYKSKQYQEQVKDSEEQVKKLESELDEINSRIKSAQESGNYDEVSIIALEGKQTNEKLSEVRKERDKLDSYLHTVLESVGVIEDTMNRLSEDPALNEHINDVVAKRFSRAIVSNEKKIAEKQSEKQEIQNKNNILLKIQAEAKKDPNVMYTLVQIGNLNKEIENAKNVMALPIYTKPSTELTQEQLQDYNDAKNSVEKSQSALEAARKSLAQHFKGQVPREIIDQIESYTDLEKSITANNRKIRRIDRQIGKHNETIADYKMALELNTKNKTRHTRSSSVQMHDSQPIEHSQNFQNNLEPGEYVPSSNNSSTENLPAKEPKWYQFITRFRNYRARKKAEKENKLEDQQEITEENQGNSTEIVEGSREELQSDTRSENTKDKSYFKSSMQYQVVQDYANERYRDLLRDAKKTRSQETQNQETQENENEER